MKDSILSADEAVAAESWVLPSVGGGPIFTARGAGFKSDLGGHVDKPSKRPKHAFTNSYLEEVEHEVRLEAAREGRQEGYNQGFEQGSKRAAELGVESTNAQVELLNQLINQITVDVTENQQQLQNLLLKLISQVSFALCRAELSLCPEKLSKIVAEVVEVLPIGESHVEIQLNPLDLDELQKIPNAIDSRWRVATDETITRGGVIVDSLNSHVDATLERRLQDIVEHQLT